MEEGFTTQIKVTPPYDYRDDVADGRGCHGMAIVFILTGPAGAISWSLSTGLMANAVFDPDWRSGCGRPPHRIGEPGWDRFGWDRRPRTPTAGPVESHSAVQSREWWDGPHACDMLPGGQCFGDAGYLIGDRALTALLEGGDTALWVFLREIYDEWLGPVPDGDIPAEAVA